MICRVPVLRHDNVVEGFLHLVDPGNNVITAGNSERPPGTKVILNMSTMIKA